MAASTRDTDLVRGALGPKPAASSKADDDADFMRDLGPGTPTKSDQAGFRDAGRAQGDAQSKAYHRGKAGKPIEPGDDPDAYRSGQDEGTRPSAPTPRRGRASQSRTRPSGGAGGLATTTGTNLRKVAAGRPTGTTGGLFLGVFAYALGLSVLREGPTGPVRWLSAKFLNKIIPGPGSAAAAPGPAAAAAPKAAANPSQGFSPRTQPPGTPARSGPGALPGTPTALQPILGGLQ